MTTQIRFFSLQAINLIVAVLSMSVAPLTGILLASRPILGTLPYGLQFATILIATYPMALLMVSRGRFFAFRAGVLSLIGAGISGFFALQYGIFILLLFSHVLLGIYIATANFYRFAVTDSLEKNKHSHALSLVVASGVLAGFIAPALAVSLRQSPPFAEFALCYAVLLIFAVISWGLLWVLPRKNGAILALEAGGSKIEESISVQQKLSLETGKGRLEMEGGRARAFLWIGMIATAVSYGLMNLLMIQSSLKMIEMGFTFEQIATGIKWHIVAMFAPAFLIGRLVTRFGALPLILNGFVLFLCSFGINIYFVGGHGHGVGIYAALILLGLGWSGSYVAGSTLLTSSHQTSGQSIQKQGLGDTAVALFAFVGALLSSVLFFSIGWRGTNAFSMTLTFISVVMIVWLAAKTRKA